MATGQSDILYGLLVLIVTVMYIGSCDGKLRHQRSVERRLYDQVVRGYDWGSRPVLNANHCVTVNFSMSLNRIMDLAEKNQTLITHMWVYEEWYDQMVSWKPERYSDIESITVPANMLWLPDIYIFNNADKGFEGFVSVTESRLVVRHDGHVSWSLPLIVKSSCAVDVAYFPFDSQQCFVRFGSWIYDVEQLNLVLKQNQVDLSEYVANSEFDLVATRLERNLMTYDMFNGKYPQVTLHLHIKRKPLYYSYTVIAPVLVLCILNIFSFILPCDNGEKVGIGLTVFLSLYVLQLAIAENIPESNSLPLIGLFLTLVMTLNAVSLVCATLVINIKKKGDRKPCPEVPNVLYRLCRDVLGRITCTYMGTYYDFYKQCPGSEDPSIPSCSSSNQDGGTATSADASGDELTFSDGDKKKKALVIKNRRLTRKSSGPKNNTDETKNLFKRESFKRLNTMRRRRRRVDFMEEFKDPRIEWYFVAEVLDKSLFVLFMVAMGLTVSLTLIILPWLHDRDTRNRLESGVMQS